MPVWRRPTMRMSGCLPRVVPSGFSMPWISPTGSSKVESPAALQTACTANFSLSWVLLALPPALAVVTQSRWSKALRGLRGGVVRVAAARSSLVVVGVGEAGHAEVKFLSNTHLDEVGCDLEARFERAHAMPDHRMWTREGVHGGRNLGGCGLVELTVPASVFQV